MTLVPNATKNSIQSGKLGDDNPFDIIYKPMDPTKIKDLTSDSILNISLGDGIGPLVSQNGNGKDMINRKYGSG
eukprot:CAMPEP_0184870824 /NCGR_PEP_ID=MMETSP0580-20130426/38934_1 /TAXON_ID=1118495 /ORGANISM="Dactyliosolen fragilissimus" /LENGTH=73 /DNA_ID=CAMNT_0027373139 /DNA_START=71 /DNA_END=292 /DNA_ORIENTATION=-